MTDDLLKFLSTVKLFSEFNSQELLEIAGDFCVERYAPGTDIVKAGDEVFRFFILVEGRAEAIKSKKGRDFSPVHNSFTSGEYFGEISLFTGSPSPVTLRTIENSTVLIMNAENFARMLVRWPKLYERFLRRLSSLINHIDDRLWETRHREFLRSSLQIKQLEQKFYGLWGNTKSTRQAEKTIDRLAACQDHILLIGERGTGRQMMAWFLHKKQFGETAPFIVVDAHHFDQQWGDLMFKTHNHDGSLSLFKGSNLLDIAEGGTLFIREINLISPRTQQKLSEAMQSDDINCRVIGSLTDEPEMLSQRMNNELRECFKEKWKTNPLRERKRDITVIAQGVIDKLAAQYERKAPELSKEAIRFLLAHDYRQGNVTELIRVTERAFFLADSDEISLEHLFFGSVNNKSGTSINLLSWPWLKSLVIKGIFPIWIKNFITVVFLAVIALFLIDPQYRPVTLIFTFIWALCWPALTIFSPSLGRIWCMLCPFSGVMGWLQKIVHFKRPVPDFIKKYDYLIITVLFFLVFWIEEVTEMRYNTIYTGILIICVLGAASVFAVIYTRNTWCRHICPLGNFAGMASVSGVLETRSDATVCLNKCTSYECYRGNEDKGIGGCPTFQYMPYVDNNLECVLCLQCVRNCPNDAVRLNLRIPARELWNVSRINQGYVIFVAASLAALGPILYFATIGRTMLQQEWRFWFTLFYWGAIIAAIALTWLIARPFQKKTPSRRIKVIFSLIPLVFAGYVVYQIRYLPGADSLLLGLGWKTANGIQNFYFPGLLIGQLLAIMAGLIVSGFTIIMVLLRHKSE